MNIAVFGATGLTGRLVVERALAKGHRVTALVRNPDIVSLKHEQLTIIGGSPTSPADVEACVRGADVVIHCLGVGGKGDGKRTTLISDSVKAALTAMQKHGVPRIVCMSNVGTGGSGPSLVNRVVLFRSPSLWSSSPRSPTSSSWPPASRAPTVPARSPSMPRALRRPEVCGMPPST